MKVFKALLTILTLSVFGQAYSAAISEDKPPVRVTLKNETAFDFKYQTGGEVFQDVDQPTIKPNQSISIDLVEDVYDQEGSGYKWVTILDIDGKHKIRQYQPTGGFLEVTLRIYRDQQNRIRVQKITPLQPTPTIKHAEKG